MYNDRANRAEINRLNAAIAAEEQNINTLFQKMGQTYYAAHRADPEDSQKDFIRGVQETLERAKQYKEQINVLRGIAICPNCKAEVSVNAAFCNHCGTQMPVRKPVIQQPMVDPNTVICTRCGNRCSNTQRFCNQCGSPLSAPAVPAAPAYVPPAPQAYNPPAPPVYAAPAPQQTFEPAAPVQPPMPEPPAMPEQPPMPEPPAMPEQPPMPEQPSMPEQPPMPEQPTEPVAAQPAFEPVVAQPPIESIAAQQSSMPEPPAPDCKICPNCGTKMDLDCNFCLECGTRL